MKLFRFLLILIAVATVIGLYLWSAEGYRYYSVQSDSMQPTLHVGDLTIDQKTHFDHLKTGDIVSYASPINPNLVITHRIKSLNRQTGQIITRGDNLVSADDRINSSQVLGISKLQIPYLGYVLDALHNAIGLVAIIYIPVLTIALIELRKLAKPRTYKHANIT